jgi:hypothetical protein
VRKNECLIAILSVLDDAQIAYVVEHGGKHLKIWFVINGRRQRCICPVSPSDVNAQHNARAFARRMVRDRTV